MKESNVSLLNVNPSQTESGIWFIVALPLPWIIGDPNIPIQQLTVVLQMIGFISIPFVALAVAWTLKPELTQNN